MYGLKALFAFTTIAATITVGYLYSREVQKNEELRRQRSEARTILNKYYLDALLADPTLVGRRESEMPELATTCELVSGQNEFLAQFLSVDALTTETSSRFPNPKPEPSDRGYLYSLPMGKSLGEGRHLDGYMVYVKGGTIIGVYPNYCYLIE